MRLIVRRVRNVIIAALIIAIGIKVASVAIEAGCDIEPCCRSCETLNVTRIIDGDTLVSDRGRVRLYGVDTPEVGQRCADDATDRLKGLAGSKVRVESGPRSTDRYGRLLYYVYDIDGDSIDARLILEGLARAWTEDGQHRDLLVSLEEKARGAGRGCLW
jgi:endonuclease YncB( thermonuclease family)